MAAHPDRLREITCEALMPTPIIPNLNDNGQGKPTHPKLPEDAQATLGNVTSLDRTSESQDAEGSAQASSVVTEPVSDASSSASEKAGEATSANPKDPPTASPGVLGSEKSPPTQSGNTKPLVGFPLSLDCSREMRKGAPPPTHPPTPEDEKENNPFLLDGAACNSSHPKLYGASFLIGDFPALPGPDPIRG